MAIPRMICDTSSSEVRVETMRDKITTNWIAADYWGMEN
jgi:hypothetical protein